MVLSVYIIVVVLLLGPSCSASYKIVDVDVDWASFLSRHDPVWNWNSANNWTWVPDQWFQGGFIGNGLVGSLITTNTTTHSVQWEVGRSDVWDHRVGGSKLSTDNNFAYDRPRLPIGQFVLSPTSNVVSGSMNISIYDAQVFGNIETQTGNITWRSFSHANYNATIIEVFNSNEFEFVFVPEKAISPWYILNPTSSYPMNPDPYITTLGPFKACYQPLLAGGGYVTAWTQVQVSDTHAILYFSTGLDFSDINVAANQVSSWLTEIVKTDYNDFIASHQQWWHDYFPASFVTIPDTKIEGFYWLQVLKMGSATRSDRPVLDLMGPWMVPYTAWPDIHLDLNLQLTYWPMYTSNRLTLAQSLLAWINNNIENMKKNVPDHFNDAAALPVASGYDGLSSCYWMYAPDCLIEPPEMTGNLLWLCHDYWLHYRRSLDPNTLNGLYTILRKAVNFYLQFIEYNSPDGYYHLPVTFSPEYPITGPDTNYDLMLLKWGCTTLLQIVDILKINDPLAADWQNVLDHLVPYPVDPTTNSFMIAAGVPLNISHRHYSHLFAIYPLGEVVWDDVASRNLIESSIDNWIGQAGGLTGFSLTGAASMSARIGRPEAALGNITLLLETMVTPNTFYHEGSNFPVIETPLSAADSVHDMLLQSWTSDGLIRVFPAVSATWSEAAFSDLLAEGAFEVSAVRSNSSTQFIQVTSLAGSPCVVQTDMKQPIVAYPATITITVTQNNSGLSVVTIDLAADQTVVLYTKGADVNSFSITPLVGNVTQNHYWGFHPLQ